VIVVADASPLAILAKLGSFELLNMLFPRLHISSEVYHEVVIAGTVLA
jgi:predicted nucleic acid-binding protein